MKSMMRLVALVLVLVASLTTLPSAAQVVVLWPKTCEEFCATALCLFPQTCGTYVDSTGTKRCGCHN